MEEQNDSWHEWSRHVLSELKRHDYNHEKLSEAIDKIESGMQEKFINLHEDIVTLKTKSSTWGATAGVIGGALVSAIISALFK